MGGVEEIKCEINMNNNMSVRRRDEVEDEKDREGGILQVM